MTPLFFFLYVLKWVLAVCAIVACSVAIALFFIALTYAVRELLS